jgi:hypothetical protein
MVDITWFSGMYAHCCAHYCAPQGTSASSSDEDGKKSYYFPKEQFVTEINTIKWLPRSIDHFDPSLVYILVRYSLLFWSLPFRACKQRRN